MIEQNTLPAPAIVETESLDRPDILSPTERRICVLSIVIGCIAAAFWWWTRTSLWEDEIIAITHANQPLPLFFVELLRNDIHPPLYFLQLKIWRDLGLTSDTALLLNSLAWAFVTIATLFHVTRVSFGRNAALVAAGVYAVMPIFAFSGANLRMYSLIPTLAICVWHANRQWFASGRNKWLVFAVLAELALAYMHAIEFFFVAFIVMATLVEWLLVKLPGAQSPGAPSQRCLMKWFGFQVFAGLCLLPLVGSALVRGSDAGAPESVWSVLTEPGALVAGWGPDGVLPIRLAGFVIFAILTLAALRNRTGRIVTLVIPVAVLALAIVVSLTFKPMLKVPVFASNLLPFLALAAGAGLVATTARWLRRGVMASLLVLCAAAIPLVLYQTGGDAYASAGRYLKASLKPGDVVVVPNISVYWGICRYVIGYNWGKPLEIMPMQNNPQWQKLIDKLGANRAAMMGLFPRSDSVTSNDVVFVIGQEAASHTTTAARVWVVQRDGYVNDARLGAKYVRESLVRPAAGDLMVSMFSKGDGGGTVASHPFHLPKGQRPDIPVLAKGRWLPSTP